MGVTDTGMEHVETTAAVHACTRVRYYVGAVERWVDEVHEGEAHTGAQLVKRIVHAVHAMRMYTVYVTRPAASVLHAKREAEKRKKHARWLICARLVCIYKGDTQKETIQRRLREREGLVCAHTRDIGRVTPRGGVTYDETKRRGNRIKDDEMYGMMKRWPRRDKCGPTMIGILHHAWGIT